MKNMRKGFTLVELMVVIVIIGILAALAIPRFLGATNKSKASEFKPVLKQVYTLEMAYFQEKDTYGNTATLISFDVPDQATSRFSYAVVGAGTQLATAAPLANKIKDLNNAYLTSSDFACVDSTGSQSAATDKISGVSNLSVNTATCK